MAAQKKKDTQIVTYRIPRIEVYQVTDDELRRVEEGSGQVGQDLTFAVASLSFALAFLITLCTTALTDPLHSIFIGIVIICAIVFLYTGVRWWRTRTIASRVIASIRSRKDNPDVSLKSSHSDKQIQELGG